nr:hemerythrin domain-containing protein [Nitratifractor salsuginis]
MVKQWKKEHEELVILGEKVIGEYVKNNQEATKRYLKKFVDMAVDHLGSEDIEMFKMLRDTDMNDKKVEELIFQFQNSFKDTKMTLMKFLAKYVRDDAQFDEEFFDTFQNILEILKERINYEEDNLYLYLSLS